MLHFDLDKSGKVLDWKIMQESGFTALDEEVTALIQRVTFPPFPNSMNMESLHLTVPVEFSLKTPEP